MKILMVAAIACAALIPTQAESQQYGYYSKNAQRFMGIPFGVPRMTYVSHPPGCPGRAFCGCGASVRVFGKPVRGLYLASNWLEFPRAAPAPGMVAARRHHVFVLESQINGNIWMAYDANSGGHRTRVHARSLSGYTIVNPRG